MDFDIEKSTGSIVIARALDAKKRSNYNLTVEVTNGSSLIKTQASVLRSWPVWNSLTQKCGNDVMTSSPNI